MMRRLPHARILMLMAGCALLGACSETKLATYAVKEASGPEKSGAYKIGKPYQISGVWYYPTEDYNYNETGIASWYGPDFHGKKTANGEIFDQNDVSAAHRTLPMPSFVRVTNLDNGRSLIVRINDRGPYAHGRVLDLSRRAAQLLGIEGRGTAKVQVEIMAEESRALAMRLKAGQGEAPQVVAAPRESVVAESLPPPGSHDAPKPIAHAAAPAAASGPVSEFGLLAKQQVKQEPVKSSQQVYVQAGAFSRYDNANRASATLQPMGSTAISQVQTKTGTFFRVRMGPIPTVGDADALLEKIISSGYPEAKLVVD